jgi:AraC-like DNA-binding protein
VAKNLFLTRDKSVKRKVQEYLLAKKLSHAKDLLSKGYTVAEAGYSVGFFDSSHFISVFKKRFKQTPCNYKKSTVN